MKIQISEHFTTKKLLTFCLPSIIMMVFTSVYGVVDGLFVSNYAGDTAFASVNFIMPLLMAFGSLGFMFGTGGSAIVAKTFGEGKKELANQYFTMIVSANIITGVVLAIIGFIFLKPAVLLMGASEEMLDYCLKYGRVLICAVPFFMLQNVFQSFFITAGKPDTGLKISILSGVTNMIFDFLFIGVFRWGVTGAALATALCQIVGAVIPLFYFSRKNTSLLRFVKFKFNKIIIFRTCTNGSSELMTNISMSVVNMLYNSQLMKYAGKDGVSTYGVIMYVSFIFVSIFIGLSIGSAPIISYNYGAKNSGELKNIFRKCLMIISVIAVAMVIISQAIATPLAKIFVGYKPELFKLTVHAFRIYAISFMLAGFNIYGSSFFTALNNGVVSAIISFLRTLLFQILMVMLIPLVFGLDGIWSSIIFAELFALFVTVFFIFRNRKKYGYM
ncbi:MAG: MATE family efflux transporter [Muribaculaceae bacterium]|nr:MATE family efflux transporter [Alistipes senegalensis]MCM1473828.1 MATE family efflux transporter [Muribaculaceae bacterium]